MSRPDWDTYFFQVAATVATRATCPRASIGAVLVKNKRILSTGYNGPASGQPHCPTTPEHMALAHCLASKHAERNALENATVQLYGGTMYVVGPRVVCPDCRDAMQQCGVEYRYRPSVLTLDALSDDIWEWARVTFPRSTAESWSRHLLKEAHELAAEPTSGEEMADVFHLLVSAARVAGVDLVAEVARKFAINRTRTWGQPDALGVVEHIREAAS